ncbi:MAG: hypothetical protein JSR64_17000 [Nitrospira sp.]|nr:hypothetical protein [Nitrospira sp.]
MRSVDVTAQAMLAARERYTSLQVRGIRGAIIRALAEADDLDRQLFGLSRIEVIYRASGRDPKHMPIETCARWGTVLKRMTEEPMPIVERRWGGHQGYRYFLREGLRTPQ